MLCYRFLLSQKVSSSSNYVKLYDGEILPLLLRRPITVTSYSTLQCTGAKTVSARKHNQEQDFIRSSRYLFHTSPQFLKEPSQTKPHLSNGTSERTATTIAGDGKNDTVSKNAEMPAPLGIDPETEKLGLFARFKKMYKEYWYVLLPVHVVTSAGWLGGFYYLSLR